jgi:hypothetical protein
VALGIAAWGFVFAWTASLCLQGHGRQAGHPPSVVEPRGPLPTSAFSDTLPHDDDVVAAVDVDIDTDGDMDVVTVDSRLQLYIWINDGAGHFTRREPAPAKTLHDDAQPRVVGGNAIGVAISTTPNRQPKDLRSRTTTPPLIPAGSPVAERDHRLRSVDRSGEISRAPPAHPVLT